MAYSPSREDIDDRIQVQVLELPEVEEALLEIRSGLLRKPREISSKFFYDDYGSALFDQICDLPEYYQTRTERALLSQFGKRILEESGADVLVELGSGMSSKTRVLLDLMERTKRISLYVPFDVNEGVIQRVAGQLTTEYQDLRIHGVVGDFMKHVEFIPDEGKRLVIFLGGTIGNLLPNVAISLLTEVGAQMRKGEYFLLGTDLIKAVDRLEAAYNDSQGITAEFNKNVLRVLNDLVGADFDQEAFEHRAFYDREMNRIEMWLRSTRLQEVSLPRIEMEAVFQKGEEILTEISVKYDRERAEALFKKSGLQMVEWMTDPEELFALSLAKKV